MEPTECSVSLADLLLEAVAVQAGAKTQEQAVDDLFARMVEPRSVRGRPWLDRFPGQRY